MPFISFAQAPESLGVGRQARGVSVKDTGADWVAEVDEVEPGETEIGAPEFAAAVAANDVYNAANPPPAPAPKPPSAQQQAVAAVQAIDLDAITDPAVRAAFEALRDAALGERQPREFTVLQTEGLT